MSRSKKQQREALEDYKTGVRIGQRGGEGYMESYKRHAKEYQERVWKEANAKKKEK
jgi:hypothetical protein